MSAVRVPLTRGQFALVSAEDAERVLRHKWTYHSKGYAYRTVTVEGKQVSILLHRFIFDLPGEGHSGRYVDHRDGDKLNCQRDNLRVCTNRQNQHNRQARTSRTGLKGVEQLPSGRFRAYIQVDGKKRRVGPTCEDATEAARHYDAAARLHFGEFAHTNF